jgi:hypothetical protein
VGKTMINKPAIWEWFIHATYKNGDDWGMVAMALPHWGNNHRNVNERQ